MAKGRKTKVFLAERAVADLREIVDHVNYWFEISVRFISLFNEMENPP